MDMEAQRAEQLRIMQTKLAGLDFKQLMGSGERLVHEGPLVDVSKGGESVPSLLKHLRVFV